MKKNCWLYLFLAPIFVFGKNHLEKKSDDPFIQNKGQWPSTVHYKTKVNGAEVFLETNKLAFVLYNEKQIETFHELDHDAFEKGLTSPSHKLTLHAFYLNLVGSNSSCKVQGEGMQQAVYSYFLGSDPSKWGTGAKVFSSILYSDVYQGIDLKVYKETNHLKYDFRVTPGTDPAKILLKYEGLEKPALVNGRLVFKTSVGELIEGKPVAFQTVNGKQVYVQCNYKINSNGAVSFSLGKFEKSLPLIIDPLVVASTYCGGTSSVFGHSATYDSTGNIYGGGLGFAVGYPATAGAYDISFNGAQDMVISKLSPDGSALLYATYVGGSNGDHVHSMVVSKKHELYVYGSTASANFPTSAFAPDNTLGGPRDIVLFRLSQDGSQLLSSTYVGGSGTDGQNPTGWLYGDTYRGEIFIDEDESVLVATFSNSPDFPVTAGAFDVTMDGLSDAVLLKMDSTLNIPYWSTFLGGSGNDGGYAVRGDGNGGAFMIGTTQSNDFPMVSGGVVPTYQGGTHDAFVVHINSFGNTMVSSTFFGTNQRDGGFFIDTDSDSGIYIYGTSVGDIPVSSSVYSNPSAHCYIAKLNFNLSSITFSTVFGGPTNSNFAPSAFVVDQCENIYAGGFNATADFPVTTDAVYGTLPPGGSYYAIVLEKNVLSQLYGTFYYGGHVDGGTSRFDKRGVIYQAVCTSGPFATLPTAYSPGNVGGFKLALFKIDFQTDGVNAAAAGAPSLNGCAPFTVNFQNLSNTALTYEWDFDDGSSLDTAFAPVHLFSDTGSHIVRLVAFNPSTCNESDTTWLLVQVFEPVNFSLGPDTTMFCEPELLLDAGFHPASTFTWSTAESTQAITVDTDGDYWVTVANPGCSLTDSIQVDFDSTVYVNLGPDTIFCDTVSVVLDAANPGTAVLWSTGDTSQTISVSIPGLYFVSVITATCTGVDSVQLGFGDSPSYFLGPDTSLCDGAALVLNAGSPGIPRLWSTGDSGISVPVTSAGWYWVASGLPACNSVDSVLISIGTTPNPFLGEDSSFCDFPAFTLNAESPGCTYLWSTGATTASILAQSTGLYSVLVSNNGCMDSDSVLLEFLQTPVVNLTGDTVLCDSIPLVITTSNTSSDLLWSTGETGSSIVANHQGWFGLTVSNGRCMDVDSMQVRYVLNDMNLKDEVFCAPALTLDAGNAGGSFKWSTGETTQTIVADSSGVYQVEVFKESCRFEGAANIVLYHPEDSLFVPNVFTPDGDGFNALFSWSGTSFKSFHIFVYNRWGKLIYESEDPQGGWNGTYASGQEAPEGVYYFVMDFEPECPSAGEPFSGQKKGFVTLARK